MKRISLSVFIVLMLISFDITISMAYADTKVKIFKVTNISKAGKLHIRAWPSPKSRIKVSLPSTAKDLLETGKSKVVGKSKWVEISWKKSQGWVNSRYLKKTGVLLHAKRNSRNANSTKLASKKSSSKNRNPVAVQPAQEAEQQLPGAFGGDRYDQPAERVAELKTAYSANGDTNKVLRCSGSSPEPWHINMNIAKQSMQIKLAAGKTLTMPIRYHAWASPSKIRMSLGGNKGRNVVDVNLEKTDACSNGLNNINYPYAVNATINRKFLSGCCQSATR